MIQFSMLTRPRAEDYGRWIPSPEEDLNNMWNASDSKCFEHPEVLFKSLKEGWYLLLSYIDSGRKDIQGRPISVSFLLKGTDGDTPPIPLISHFLKGVPRRKNVTGRLTDSFKEEFVRLFNENDVASVFNTADEAGQRDILNNFLKCLLDAVGEEEVGEDEVEYDISEAECWYGDVRSDVVVKRFLNTITFFVRQGDPFCALYSAGLKDDEVQEYYIKHGRPARFFALTDGGEDADVSDSLYVVETKTAGDPLERSKKVIQRVGNFVTTGGKMVNKTPSVLVIACLVLAGIIGCHALRSHHLHGKYRDLKAEVSKMETELSGLRSENSELREELNKLSGQLSELRKPELETEVSKLRSENSELRKEQNKLSGQLNKLLNSTGDPE